MKAMIFIALVMLSVRVSAEPLTLKDRQNLDSYPTIEHVVYETYTSTDTGASSVFGYQFDRFVSPSLYGALAIYGAVGGNRGGYGIAAVGLGYRTMMMPKLYTDFTLLAGSGGGGGIPAGGGLAFECHSGISYEFLPHVFADLKGGYLAFPSGTFQTPIIQIGISYQMNRLFLPY